jgi:hypothetical protein
MTSSYTGPLIATFRCDAPRAAARSPRGSASLPATWAAECRSSYVTP